MNTVARAAVKLSQRKHALAVGKRKPAASAFTMQRHGAARCPFRAGSRTGIVSARDFRPVAGRCAGDPFSAEAQHASAST